MHDRAQLKRCLLRDSEQRLMSRRLNIAYMRIAQQWYNGTKLFSIVTRCRNWQFNFVNCKKKYCAKYNRAKPFFFLTSRRTKYLRQSHTLTIYVTAIFSRDCGAHFTFSLYNANVFFYIIWCIFDARCLRDAKGFAASCILIIIHAVCILLKNVKQHLKHWINKLYGMYHYFLVLIENI